MGWAITAKPPAARTAATASASSAHWWRTAAHLPSPRNWVNAACLLRTKPCCTSHCAMWVRDTISGLAANDNAPAAAPPMPRLASFAPIFSMRSMRPCRNCASKDCRLLSCSSKSKPTMWMVRPRQVTEISTPLIKRILCCCAAERAAAKPPVWSWSVSASMVQPFFAASATTSSGGSAPSEIWEWQCRSIMVRPFALRRPTAAPNIPRAASLLRCRCPARGAAAGECRCCGC